MLAVGVPFFFGSAVFVAVLFRTIGALRILGLFIGFLIGIDGKVGVERLRLLNFGLGDFAGAAHVYAARAGASAHENACRY